MNSNHIDTTKTSAELKDQVIRDIQKVKDDLSEIQKRMTPGQIIDDALFYRGVKSPSETFHMLKANPVGTTFLTLGTLLLLENDQHMSHEAMAWKRKDEITSKLNENVSMAKAKIAEVRGQVDSFIHKNRGTEYTQGEIRENIDTGLETMKDKVTQTFENVQNVSSEKMQTASSKISEAGQSLYQSSKDLDPLTYIALGIGLGAITGAAIPVSHMEEDFVHSNLDFKFGNFNQELQKAVNESVNIFKKEFIGGITDFDLNLFR